MSSDSGSGSASGAVSRGGTSSPAIVPAAGPPPPPGGPEGTGASVEQNMAFAQFQERARGEG
jgi:hypothetical protein